MSSYPTLPLKRFVPTSPFRGSELDVTTVLLNGNTSGEPRTLARGAQLKFTVAEILEFAEVDHPERFGETMPADSAGLPLMVQRFGVEVTSTVSCYNSALDLPPGSGSDITTNASSPVCLLAFRVTRLPASPLSAGVSMHEVKEHFGVVVRCEEGFGFFRDADIDRILVNFTSVCIVLSLPRELTLFVALYCLGLLSTIYTGVIKEKFSLSGSCGPIAARLMAFSVPFDELADREHPKKGGIVGISHQMMQERLEQILRFRSSELDKDELANFVTYCFSQLTKRKSVDDISWLAEEIEQDEEEADTENDVIDIDLFSVACTENELVSLDEIVKLFDRNRHMGLLERLFVPTRLEKVIHGHEKAAGPADHSHQKKHRWRHDHAAHGPQTLEAPAAALASVVPSKPLVSAPAPPLAPSAEATSEAEVAAEIVLAEQACAAEAGTLQNKKRQLLRDIKANEQHRRMVEDMHEQLTHVHAKHAVHHGSVQDEIIRVEEQGNGAYEQVLTCYASCLDFSSRLDALDASCRKSIQTAGCERQQAHALAAERVAALEALLQRRLAASMIAESDAPMPEISSLAVAPPPEDGRTGGSLSSSTARPRGPSAGRRARLAPNAALSAASAGGIRRRQPQSVATDKTA